MARCLYCYKELPPEHQHYHPACAKKMFGTTKVPIIEFDHTQLSELALQVILRHTTVTGVQQKLSLDLQADNKKQPQRFTIVGLWGRFILKPQTDEYPHLPEVEDLTMHLAELAGIQVVPHTLIPLADGKLAYLTRRIDRTNTGEKIPMEDMCQLSERLTAQKYNGSYEQIAKIIQKHSTARQLDTLNFWEIVLFSWLVGNSDMHLKNFSLYSPTLNQVCLTPAYDLLNVQLVTDDQDELALTLKGKKSKLKRVHFEEVMRNSKLNEKSIANIFHKFQQIAPTWMEWIDNSFLPADMQENYKTLITQRLQRLENNIIPDEV